MENLIYPELSYKIVGVAMEIHRELGPGFLEKVYENSMMVIFGRDYVPAVQQCPTPVFFQGNKVGNYIAWGIIREISN